MDNIEQDLDVRDENMNGTDLSGQEGQRRDNPNANTWTQQQDHQENNIVHVNVQTKNDRDRNLELMLNVLRDSFTSQLTQVSMTLQSHMNQNLGVVRQDMNDWSVKAAAEVKTIQNQCELQHKQLQDQASKLVDLQEDSNRLRSSMREEQQALEERRNTNLSQLLSDNNDSLSISNG